MQLIQNGDGLQAANWEVKQNNSAGYSRIYYIKSGEVTYSDKNMEYRLKSGRLYVFPSHRPYSITHNPENPINCLWFHVDMFPYEVESIMEFDFSKSENNTLSLIVSALDLEFGKKSEQDSLFLLLSEAMMQFIKRHPQVKKPNAALLEILGYIRENIFSEALTVRSISKNFGYTESHFIRMFNRGMNTTPHQYIARMRLSAAAKLLLEGASVCEAALSSGYNDTKNFSKAFKKHFSVAPSEYSKFYIIQA